MLAHVRSTTPGSEDVTVRYVNVVYLQEKINILNI